MLAEKALCYRDFYASGGFALRCGATAAEFRDYPFRVLIILQTAERRNNTAERLMNCTPRPGREPGPGKYVAQRRVLTELRTTFEKTGSNLLLDNRKIGWEPRGAWQLVVDQGRFAQANAAPRTGAASSVGETDVITTKCTRQGSNLQPSVPKTDALSN
jgi:hypothetical protein